MQFIHSVLTFNEILTVSLLSWFVAQVLKTIINFVLLGRFQLERMWALGIPPSPHMRSSWNLPSRMKLIRVLSTCATNHARSDTVRMRLNERIS